MITFLNVLYTQQPKIDVSDLMNVLSVSITVLLFTALLHFWKKCSYEQTKQSKGLLMKIKTQTKVWFIILIVLITGFGIFGFWHSIVQVEEKIFVTDNIVLFQEHVRMNAGQSVILGFSTKNITFDKCRFQMMKDDDKGKLPEERFESGKMYVTDWIEVNPQRDEVWFSVGLPDEIGAFFWRILIKNGEGKILASRYNRIILDRIKIEIVTWYVINITIIIPPQLRQTNKIRSA